MSLDTTKFVFAPSLQGSKERAVLGLHAAWERRGAKSGEHPPPPLMVMVAALLRNPSLDVIRLQKAGLPLPEGQSVPTLDELVKSDNHEAVAEVPLQPVEFAWRYYCAEHDMRARSQLLLRHAAASLVDTGLRAVRFGSARSFCALIARFDELLPDAESAFATGAPVEPVDLGWLAHMPGIAAHPSTEAIRAASRCVIRSGAGGSYFVAKRALKDVRRKYDGATVEAQRGLPIADLRELVKRARDPTDALTKIRGYVRRGEWSASAAIDALIQLQEAGIAAALFGALGKETKDVPFKLVQRAARAQEVFRILSCGITAFDANSKPTTPPPFVVSAFLPEGQPAVRFASPEALGGLHVLLQSGRQLNAGAYAYHSRSKFEARWAHIARGLLDGWDWRNCVAAGGAVVRALIGEDHPEHDTAFGDIDLFFYGLGYTELRARVQALADHVRAKVGVGNYAVLLTSKNVTIVVEGLPRLQVATGLWRTAGDVLGTTDVDCCGVGFTGSDVVMTGRAAAAYAVRANVASASRQMVRGSIHYEMRLWKYATRYGFRVVDPITAPASGELAKRYDQLEKCFVGLSEGAAQRKAATSLKGLYWLMAVDRRLIKPFLKQDDLVVGTRRKLADVLKVVTAKGYVESDGYGTHEGGYLVVKDEDDPAPQLRRPYGEEEGWGVPREAYANTFSSFVPFSKHDSLRRYQFDVDDWLLDRPTPSLPKTTNNVRGAAPNVAGRPRSAREPRR